MPRPPAVPKAPQARYTNYFEVAHTAHEFLLDCGQLHPEVETVALHTRIALNPPYAKLLVRLLGSAVREHESVHGAIADVGDVGDAMAAVLRALPDFPQRAAAVHRRDRDAVAEPRHPPKRSAR